MEELLTQEQVAELLGVTPKCLEARRFKGQGPPFIRLSNRWVRYAPSDVEAWLAAHRENAGDLEDAA